MTIKFKEIDLFIVFEVISIYNRLFESMKDFTFDTFFKNEDHLNQCVHKTLSWINEFIQKVHPSRLKIITQALMFVQTLCKDSIKPLQEYSNIKSMIKHLLLDS